MDSIIESAGVEIFVTKAHWSIALHYIKCRHKPPSSGARQTSREAFGFNRTIYHVHIEYIYSTLTFLPDFETCFL